MTNQQKENTLVKVMVADRQPLFRRGIRAVLSQQDDIEIFAEAGTESELFDAINSTFPDVILFDVDLSGESNLSTVKAIKRQIPGAAIIVLTPRPTNEELFEAIKARASGYLSRNVPIEEMLGNIRKAAGGGHPINDTFLTQPKVAQKVLEQFQELSWGREIDDFVSPLSPREAEILSYMARGYLNKQIADTLSISEQTIKNHVTSILRKLDASARTQAVVTAIKRGLIKVPTEQK